MNRANRNDEFNFFKILFKRVKPSKPIKPEQLGIYHYTWCCDTLNDESQGLCYDVYSKVKCLNVYEDLVEIELIDMKINDSASPIIVDLIKNNFPSYLNPKFIKWQIIN